MTTTSLRNHIGNNFKLRAFFAPSKCIFSFKFHVRKRTGGHNINLANGFVQKSHLAHNAAGPQPGKPLSFTVGAGDAPLWDEVRSLSPERSEPPKIGAA